MKFIWIPDSLISSYGKYVEGTGSVLQCSMNTSVSSSFGTHTHTHTRYMNPIHESFVFLNGFIFDVHHLFPPCMKDRIQDFIIETHLGPRVLTLHTHKSVVHVLSTHMYQTTLEHGNVGYCTPASWLMYARFYSYCCYSDRVETPGKHWVFSVTCMSREQ